MCLRAFLNMNVLLSMFKAQSGQDVSFTRGIWKQKDLSGWTAVTLHAPVMMHYQYCWVFFPLKLGLVAGRNDTCVREMQHRAHHCFKTLNSPIEILPVLLFSCSVHDTARTYLFTHCESPLQTDRDHHLNLTFSISASEWDFQSCEDNSYIPLLLWLVKAVLRSYSKCQIDRYTKIAGTRSDFLLLNLELSSEAQNFEQSVSTWVGHLE